MAGFTRKQFRDDLDAIFNDSGNSIWSAAQKNSAINQGIDALWPECKNSDVDETQTLAADTFIYTPDATNVLELGFSQAFLEQESDEPYTLMRRITQRREVVSGALKWKIDVPEDIVDANEGKKIRLHYHCKFDQYTVAFYTAATIAFVAATKKITDSANGLAIFKTGDIILVSGSTSNDGTYTVATGGVAAEIVVAEALTNEGAGATVIIDDGNTEDMPWNPVLYYACMQLCIMMLQKAGSSDIRVWRDQIPEYRVLWMQSKKDNLVLSMPQYIGLRRQ